MSSFFTATLTGKKGSGDKSAKNRSSGSRASGSSNTGQSSSSSHANDPNSSTSYNRTAQSQSQPASSSSSGYTGYSTTNGRREEAAAKANMTNASFDDMVRSAGIDIMPVSNGTIRAVPPPTAEFGGPPNSYAASSMSGHSSGSVSTARRGSDTASLRSMASTVSGLQRPNDELGRYPSITRATPPQVYAAVPTVRGTTPTPSSYTTTSSAASSYKASITTSYASSREAAAQAAAAAAAAPSLSSKPSMSRSSSESQSHSPHPPLPNATSPYQTSTSYQTSTTSYQSTTSTSSAQSTPRPPSAAGSHAPSTYTPSKAMSIRSVITPSTAASRHTDNFHFPRPDDETVEAMFAELVNNRDIEGGSIANASVSSRHSTQSVASAVARTTQTLGVNTKWQMVEADARSRFETQKRHKAKEDEAVRMGRGRRSAAALSRDSPEYIIRKVLDNQLAKNHLATLNVSLRTQPLE